MPHVSAAEAVKVALMVLVVLGSIRLVALSYPDNKVAQGFLLLY
jgi:hypothetical protein